MSSLTRSIPIKNYYLDEALASNYFNEQQVKFMASWFNEGLGYAGIAKKHGVPRGQVERCFEYMFRRDRRFKNFASLKKHLIEIGVMR